jgi:hypothetical protein
MVKMLPVAFKGRVVACSIIPEEQLHKGQGLVQAGLDLLLMHPDALDLSCQC